MILLSPRLIENQNAKTNIADCWYVSLATAENKIIKKEEPAQHSANDMAPNITRMATGFVGQHAMVPCAVADANFGVPPWYMAVALITVVAV